MTPSSDLFVLIKSMSKAEKRYFKLFASQHSRNGSNNYIKLFDGIDKQAEYNEEKLRRKFANERFSKKLAATKYLLYDLILKSLRYFHSGKSIESTINALLEEAEVLFQKTLYAQAAKVLQKAGRLAAEADLAVFSFLIREKEDNLQQYLNKELKKGDQLNRVQQSETLTKDLQNEALYLSLASKMRMLYEQCLQNDQPCNKKAIGQIIMHPLLAEGVQPSTFLGKLSYFEIHSLYEQINQQFKTAIDWLYNALALCENKERLVKAHAEHVRRIVGDLALCGLNASLYDRYPTIIAQLKSLPSRSVQEEAKMTLWVQVLEFGLLLHKGDMEASSELKEQIERSLEQHEDKLATNWLIILFYQMSVHCFQKGDFNEALDWIERVQSYEKTGLLPTIQVFCRLLKIPVHYELENFHFLEYQLRSTQRYLKRKSSNGELEAEFIRQVRKSLGLANSKEVQALFAQLKITMKNAERSSFSALPLGEKAIKMWLTRKAGPLNIEQKTKLSVRA